MTESVTLRPFQLRALEQYRKAFNQGKAHIGIAPTAFGKSIFMGVLAHRMVPKTRHRFVIIAHREALVRQNADKVSRVSPGLKVSCEIAAEHADPASDVISASVATLKGKRLESCVALWRRDGRPIFLIVDESHHCLAASYQTLISTFNPDRLLGVTATPFRPDDEGGHSLRGIFPHVGFNVDRGEMIDEGWLAKPLHWCLKTSRDISKVKSKMGDYVEADLVKELNHHDRNELVVNAADESEEKIRAMGMVGRAVCFSINIEHGNALEDMFRSKGWVAKCITGETPVWERREWDERLRTATEKTVLISCGVLTEGWDVEEVNLGIFARPTKSPVLADQMLGRVLRIHDSKTNGAIVLDFQDGESIGRVSIAATFKLPDGWNSTGQSLREDQKWFYEVLNRVSYTVRSKLWRAESREQAYRIIQDADLNTDPVLFDGGMFMWWDLGPELRMTVKTTSVVIAMTPLGDYGVRAHFGLDRQDIGIAPTIIKAVGIAERWVENNFPDSVLFIRATQDDSKPATEAQVKYLERLTGVKKQGDLTKHEAKRLVNIAVMESIREIECGRMGFGKFKGSPIGVVPTWYLNYVANQMPWVQERPEWKSIIEEMGIRGVSISGMEIF